MNTLSKKFVSGALTLTTTLWLSGALTIIPVAHGQTVAELQALIASLQAQISQLTTQLSAMSGGGTPSACSFTRDLTVGSTGEDVRCLQQWLNTQGNTVATSGAGSPGSESTYFGSRTKAALGAWQAAHQVTPSVGYLGPKTRAAIAAMAGPGPTPGPGPVPAPATGLRVSLASDNPPAGSLISSSASAAARVPVLAVNLTAGTSGGVTVSDVSFKKGGVLSDSSISSAYLVENGRVVAQYSSLTGGVISFNGVNLGVNAGQTRKVWLAIDPATGLTAGNTVSFSLDSASAVKSWDASNNAITATGVFPLNGNVFTVTSVSNPAIASVTISSSSVGTSVYAGTQDVLVSQWSVTTNNSPVNLTSMTYKVVGSASKSDVRNVKLLVNGTQAGPTLAQVSPDGTAHFDLSSAPVRLNTGSGNIQVKADVMGSPSFNFDFGLLNSYDIYAVDTQYGVPVTVTVNGGSTGSSSGHQISIQQGQITVSLASDTPTGNIAKGGSGTTLGKFTVYAAGEPVKVQFLDYRLVFTGSSAGVSTTIATIASEVKNISLVDDAGNQVGTTLSTPTNSDSTACANTAGVSVLNYTNCFGTSSSNVNYIVPANTTRVLSLKADVQTTAGFSTVQAKLLGNTSNLRGQTSSQTASSGAVDGSSLTLAANPLTVAKDGAVGNQTYAKGKQEAKIGAFILAASSAEGVNVANMTVNVNASSTNFQNLRVKVNKTQSYGITQGTLNASTDYTFSGTVLVPAGGSVPVEVFADILTTNTGNMGALTGFKSCTGTGAVTNTSVSCAGAGITLGAGNGQNVTVSTGPSFSIALNSNTAPSKQLVLGTTGVEIVKFDFKDEGNIEAIKITDLSVTQNTGASVSQQFTNMTLWVGPSTQIKGPIGLSSAAPSFTAVFSGMGESASVPQGGVITLILKGDVPSFESGCGGSSACTGLEKTTSTFQVKASSTSSVTALGKSSNTSASHLSGTPTGNTFTILRGKLTVTGTDTNGNGGTTGRTRIGTDHIGDLTMSATGNQITVNTITLKFEGQAVSNGTAISTVRLIDPSTNTNWGGSSDGSCTTGTGNSCTANFSFSSGNTVNAGESKTLRLELSSSNFFNSANTAESLTVSVKANTDAAYFNGATTSGGGVNLDATDVGSGVVISSISYE